MGVYIPGMEMPRDCWHCFFADPEDGDCLVDQKSHGDWDEPQNCPLVLAPEHGWLLKVLKTERDCVSRDCDRDCGRCDLSLEREEIVGVYDALIAMYEPPKEETE